MSQADYAATFEPAESFALDADASDPLADYRELFHLPVDAADRPLIYFCTHSLGLLPKSVQPLMQQELDNWAMLGVEGHFHGPNPWYTYQELIRGPMARLVGGRPGEVILMNGLTINLHLMMVSFYRPQPGRHKILMEDPAFPSDVYAVKSQLRLRGYDPQEAILRIGPRQGEHVIRQEDIDGLLESHGPEIALVLLNAVNFLTGQLLDVQRVTALAKQQGCVVGWDLAHAVGNVPLNLHDWDVDFAVWCTYKYLCSGPGAVAGCFVHERHGSNLELPRLAGWWGTDPATRFRMQLPEFTPCTGVDGWQVSNPPILALLPVRVALGIFDGVGIQRLHDKAKALTSYAIFLLDHLESRRFEIITPRHPEVRGCQLSLLVKDQPRELFDRLTPAGIIADFREPNTIRIAPAPLYNTFHEVWRFVHLLSHLTD